MRERGVAVLGLGRSGLVAAEALAASGARVMAWDDGDGARRAAAERGLPVTDLSAADWSAIEMLVLSPGIPDTYPAPHPIAARAKAADVPIVSDIELLARSRREAAYIGITGTNGKSTTTAIIGHVLEAAGRPVAIGGNLGPAALGLAALGSDGTYVLEMSSYQLERSPSVVFDVAVLLNISPDHLDRHGGMDGYVAAKTRIFQNQKPSHTAVVGVDDVHCRRIHDRLAATGGRTIVPIAVGHSAPRGVYVIDGILVDDRGGDREPVMNLADCPNYPGVHNWQNVAAAYAACRAAAVGAEAFVTAARSFPGLPHRQELVAVVGGIPFVNDSKATNADAAGKAIACYDNIYWIAGGRAKAGGIEALAPRFDRIAHAFLIGESGRDFAAALRGRVPCTISETLPNAVSDAYLKATADGRPGAVVLLSPAAASFDQFADFEARGEAFRAAVRALGGENA